MIKIHGEFKITNHNMTDLCSEKFCDNKEVFVSELKIGDKMYLLNLCGEHYELVANNTTDDWV